MSTADPLAARTFDDVQRAHIRRNARNTLLTITAIFVSTWILATAQWWWGAYGANSSTRLHFSELTINQARDLAKNEAAAAQLRLNAMVQLRQQAVGAVQALQYLSADDSTRVRERADLLLGQIRKVQ